MLRKKNIEATYKWLIKALKAKTFTQKKEKGRINQETIS